MENQEENNEILDDNTTQGGSGDNQTIETQKNNELIAKLESFVFEDRVVENPNRKKIKIIEEVSDNELIADIDYLEDVSVNGNKINAEVVNTIVEAVTGAYIKSIEANNAIVKNKLSSIYNGNEFVSTLQIENIFSKLKNQVIKALTFDSYGYLKIGKFTTGNANITIDITSTSNKAKYAKLVVSCKENEIVDAVVYHDEDNYITPNLYIKPSTTESNFIEIYFKPDYMSDNIFEIKGNKINEVLTTTSVIDGITDICNFVDQIPTGTIKPTNISFNNLQNVLEKINNLTSSVENLSTNIENVKNRISNMLDGKITFTLLKANTIDLV